MSFERDDYQYNAFYTEQDLSSAFWRGLMTGIGVAGVTFAIGLVIWM